MIQIFENELGLFLLESFFVTPVVYRNQREFLKRQRQYNEACEKVGMTCVVNEDWILDSEIGWQFTQRHPFASQQVLAFQRHLLSRYNDSEGPGHQAGLVLVKLRR